MIREVDLVSYLPEFMQGYKEPVAALKAEDPEFTIVWKGTDKILYNHFISTADEYGIQRFEKLLNISPSDGDTLESRRSRCQSKWFNRVPYSMRVFLQKLMVLCDNTDFTVTDNFTEGYTLTVGTNLELYGQVEELEHIINTMLPENIVMESHNSIPCNIQGAALFSGGICFVNAFTVTNDFVEVHDVQSNIAFGGSTVQTDMLQISMDSQDTISVNGSAVFSGGSVYTEEVQISDGFNEIIRADSSAAVGAGIVLVDFIEIKS